MPHINIKHFPIQMSEEQRSELMIDITQVIGRTFRCNEDVISIALEPVEKEEWNERVYAPEIVNRAELLCKTPNY